MAAHASYQHDLAISAVSYDTLFVAEVASLLSARLRHPPVWTGASFGEDGSAKSPLHPDVSRVALVLTQRVWGHDAVTTADAAILQDRVRRKPDSVVVVSLDDEPLAPWMARLRRCKLATTGVDGVVELVLAAIANAGGPVAGDAKARTTGPTEPAVRWPEPPTPYLGQPRAHTALRRELDTICAELEPRFEPAGRQGGEHIAELHREPHRVVARLDDVGLSFSWVPGRAGTVADGRLMVIEWRGIAATRGVTALRTARPIRERVYSAEASGVDDWRWRADAPNGRASSTVNLVGEWMASAAMTAPATEEAS